MATETRTRLVCGHADVLENECAMHEEQVVGVPAFESILNTQGRLKTNDEYTATLAEQAAV